MRSVYKIEMVAKGVANRHRVTILFLLAKNGELDLEMISERLEVGYKTTSEHLRKMHLAGLISKEYEGNYVLHSLTSRGKKLSIFFSKLT